MADPTLNPVNNVVNTLGRLAVRDTAHHSPDSSNSVVLMPATGQAPMPVRQNIAQPYPQPASQLLSLPTELQLMICSYMTLSPVTADSLDWKGAFFTCRQLQKSMRDELKPEHDLHKYLDSNRISWIHPGCDLHIRIGLPHPLMHLIREITIRMPIPRRNGGSCCHHVLAALYNLYLDHLHVILVGPEVHRLPCGDLKSWSPEHFIDFVREGKVHCKKVTFTIDIFANVQDGRQTSTPIANIIPGTKILYLLELVQDKVGRQAERAYSSDVRFRPLPLRD